MRVRQPKYRQFIAIILGSIIVLLPPQQSQILPVLINITIGCLLGFIWSTESWRWGIWISGPMVVIIGLSVAFSGHLDVFLKKDLPIILLVLTSSCGGSFVGAWLRQRRTA